MCKARVRVGRKKIIVQTLGYRGKKEARSDIGDLRQARMLIVPKANAGGLKIGETVTVTVGRKKIRCKVKRWSRGSKLLIPQEQAPFADLNPRTLRRIIVK